MLEVETERLLLRHFKHEDLDDYARISADPEVMRYIGKGQPLSREDAWRSLAFHSGHWQLRGFGQWAVELKETGRLIGRIGLFMPEGWPGLEVGWLLDREYWGRGLATEGGRAALNYAFQELRAEHVVSIIHPENHASIRVAEKLGERFEKHDTVNGNQAVIYGIAASAWPDR
jgi:RimJ/RimL family protein N-acetyltransferase